VSACCWSDRRPAPAALLLALLALTASAATPAAAVRHDGIPGDTGAVTRVRVSDKGIEVIRAYGSTSEAVEESTAGRRGHARGRVQIGPTRIHVDSDIPESVEVSIPGVRIHGPIVTVGEPQGLVRVFADVHVPPGTRVDGDVVSVFGSATVEGPVTGSVVAVFGSVRLLPGAQVGGDAVAVGGGLEQAPGTTVRGETVSIGFLPTSFGPLGFGPPTLAVMLLTILMGWLATLFWAWLLSLLLAERLIRIGTTASRQSGASIFVGLISAPLVLIACLLLLVTVIGIPVALLLPFAYPLMVWTGQLAATYLLGCKLLGRPPGDAPPLRPIAAGAAFVALFFVAGAVLSVPSGFLRTLALFFALIGVLLVTGLSILGTGALLISRFGSRPSVAGPASAGVPAPPLVPETGLPAPQ